MDRDAPRRLTTSSAEAVTSAVACRSSRPAAPAGRAIFDALTTAGGAALAASIFHFGKVSSPASDRAGSPWSGGEAVKPIFRRAGRLWFKRRDSLV